MLTVTGSACGNGPRSPEVPENPLAETPLRGTSTDAGSQSGSTDNAAPENRDLQAGRFSPESTRLRQGELPYSSEIRDGGVIAPIAEF